MLTNNRKRSPYPTRNRRGATVVAVPLAHGLGPATLDPGDYERLMEDGWSDQWFFNAGTVRVRDNDVRGSLTTVARLVARARPGRVVRYADGNRLNLRRSNLYIVRGSARGPAAANTRP